MTIAFLAGFLWGLVLVTLIREGWEHDGAYRTICWTAALVGTASGALLFEVY